MSGLRNYSAGDLEPRPGVSRADQLANGANFESEGFLYLVRCVACSDSPRGRENWGPGVASGRCTWCGWSDE